MQYPWWHVPGLTSPMLIAIIAVVHILVAHYAVGGGFFLAIETHFARKKKDDAYLAYLRKHARFFILLTVVFGAITGVGIWFTIGLASPRATAELINIFVFGWAAEWAFFILEIVAAFIFYYGWTRLTPRTHIIVGWIYAIAAWVSLVLITGITAFMLHPGEWLKSGSFVDGFFNPQFLPQTVARTGGALLLCSLYVFLHAAFFARPRRIRTLATKRAAIPAILGGVLLLAGCGWSVLAMPDAAKLTLINAPAMNIFLILFASVGGLLLFLFVVGPLRNPRGMSAGFAIALFAMGIALFSTGEFIREGSRKPFIIQGHLLANQVTVDEVSQMQRDGFLQSGDWTKAYVDREFPKMPESPLAMPRADREQLGGIIFQYHCNDCHTAEQGFSPVQPKLTGRGRAWTTNLIKNLDKTDHNMPPFCGTDDEAVLLTDYLMANPLPASRPMRDSKVTPSLASRVETTSTLPAPPWLLKTLKIFGFTLHLAAMGLWLAGLPVCLMGLCCRSRQKLNRFSQQLPIIVALGINFGVVPLLFTQVLVPRFFYSATVLTAWWWLAIVLLVIPCYYVVYLLASRGDLKLFFFGANGASKLITPEEGAVCERRISWRQRFLGWTAVLLFFTIGLLYVHAFTLIYSPEKWDTLWASGSYFAAATGLASNWDWASILPRFFTIFGLACTTFAVWMVVDAAFGRGGDKENWADYRNWIRKSALALYIVGSAIFGILFGMFYVTSNGHAIGTLCIPLLGLVVLGLICKFGATKKLAILASVAQLIVLATYAIWRETYLAGKISAAVGHFAQEPRPYATEWFSLLLFLGSFVVAVVVILWMLMRLRKKAKKVGLTVRME